MNTKAPVAAPKLSTPGVRCPVVDRKLVSTHRQLEVSIPGRAEIDLVESNLQISMADVRRGLIIVNTGPGKGKTTAAMGTALRAVGQGLRVLMLQFLKGSWHYGELDAVQAFGDNFVMKQMGRGFVKVGAEKPDPEDVRMVEEAWAEAEKAIQSGEWDLVVLDEINYAISYGMLDPARVVESLQKKPEQVHVILTGRNAHPTIIEIADTVTEMRQVKHAYEKGVMAQRGIEY
jgi:cob(I)alamin adenosyltransferase